jgi:toxin ParE1/3/4
MPFKLSPNADQDIRDIYEFGLAAFGRMKAESYFDDLYDAFEYIAAHPLACRERSEIAPLIRIYVFHSHLVVYRIEDRGIVVLRILHGHSDWQGGMDF